jgi:CRISPR-associated protein Cmr3
MTIWYQLFPMDTLFFRGPEPLEAGQPSRDALFPPPVSVLQGTLRTAVLMQRGVAFTKYKANHCPPDLIDCIGGCGQPAPFHITGVLLAYQGTTYVPCPVHWFTEAPPSSQDSHSHLVGRPILRAKPPGSPVASLRIHSSAGTDLPMVCAADAHSLAGNWLRLDCLRNPPATIAAGDLLAPEELYDLEPRTGIAIDRNRKVIRGKIYSASHIRLRQDVTLLVGIDRDIGLADQGFLSLGGEQRISGYIRLPKPDFPEQTGSLFVALAPVELTDQLLPAVFASSKPIAIAGWDLAKSFHKPTSTWLPAGAVFTRYVNSSCIPLA